MLEKCKASSRIFDGHVLNLRLDQVILEDGTKSTREVVEHPGAVAIVPILNNDHILLVRQYRYAIGRDLLEIPAGTLKIAEDPQTAAIRELEEETGYKSERMKKIIEIYMAPGYTTEKIYVYLATNLQKSKTRLDEDERIEVDPVPFADALRKVRSGEICDAKTVCGLYRAEELLSTCV
jgi:ADP-ribose pyrophosphatase